MHCQWIFHWYVTCYLLYVSGKNIIGKNYMSFLNIFAVANVLSINVVTRSQGWIVRSSYKVNFSLSNQGIVHTEQTLMENQCKGWIVRWCWVLIMSIQKNSIQNSFSSCSTKILSKTFRCVLWIQCMHISLSAILFVFSLSPLGSLHLSGSLWLWHQLSLFEPSWCLRALVMWTAHGASFASSLYA